MRDHVIVKNERRALVAYSKNNQPPASPEFLGFLRGATAALDWVTGAVAIAPVTNGVLPAKPDFIAEEIKRCDALLGGTFPALAAARADAHYLNGVEHALRWLLELEAEPPVPLDERPGNTPNPNAETAPAA